MKKLLRTPGSPIQPKHLLFILCISVCLPNYVFAQEPTSKPLAELKKDAESAKKAAEDEIKKTDYDCDKIVKAIADAQKAKSEIEKQEPKAPAEPAKDAKNDVKDKYKKDKAAYDKAKADYDKAKTAADNAVAAARKCAHGLATADEIVAKLEEMKKKIDSRLTLDDQNRIKKIIDGLIERAKESAEENPCGPTEVRDEVNDELADKYEDNEFEKDPKIRELIKKWFEDNFGIDVTGEGNNKRKQPRIERDSKRKSRGFTHISVQPQRPESGPYFTIAGSAFYPLNNPNDILIDAGSLNNMLFRPETFSSLYEKFGGEFIPGDISGSQSTAFSLTASKKILPGLSLGWGNGRGLEFDTRLHYVQQQWSGSFPVMVFPQNQSNPYVETGQLSANATGLLTDLNASWLIGTGQLQPFLGGGVRVQWPISHESSGTLAGVSFPVEMAPPGTDFSVVGGAGLRLSLGRGGFVTFGGQYGKLPGGGYSAALEGRIGLTLGGARKPSPTPPVISGKIDDAFITNIKTTSGEGYTQLQFSLAINPAADAMNLNPEIILTNDGEVYGRYRLGKHGIPSGECCDGSTSCNKGKVPEGFSRWECQGICTDDQNKGTYECVLFKDMNFLLPDPGGQNWSVEVVLPSQIDENQDPLRKNNLEQLYQDDLEPHLARIPLDCPQEAAVVNLNVCATSAQDAENKAVTRLKGRYVCGTPCELKISVKAGAALGDCEENGQKGKLYSVQATMSCE
ncbi:MAG: hypothetical protein JNJ57_14725 [Saprospiraceae bacterium]|nr:hypothetical protein [Saprospiraceae bacterium]